MLSLINNVLLIYNYNIQEYYFSKELCLQTEWQKNM